MKERVDAREWVEFQWPYLMRFLGGEHRVRDLAFDTGAFARARKVESPEDLLRLVLMWAAGERSLMNVAAVSSESELADLSDVALLGRFGKCGGWLGALIGELLDFERSGAYRGVRIRVIDATVINRAGKKGIDHRLHLGLDLGSHRIDSVELTGPREGERLDRFDFAAGDIVLADRAYATRQGLSTVVDAGASFIVRFAWSNLPLEHRDGTTFDLFAALRSLPEAAPGEFDVRFRGANGKPVDARLVAIRKSEPAAKKAREEALSERRKHGAVDLRTLEAAGYFFVLTTLPPELSGASVLDLYRFRWQIEMKFKTLKSVLHLDEVPSKTDRMLRVYVLAKVLVALLIDALIDRAESFSPWGYPITATEPLGTDATPA